VDPLSTDALRINVLGPIEVWIGGTCQKATSKRVASLLGLLAATPAMRMGKDEMGAMLWPDSDSQARRRNLRQLVFLCRQNLSEAESCLQSDDMDIWLDSSVATDLSDFRRLAASDDINDLNEAQRLYRGFLLSDFDDSVILSRRQDAHEAWVDLSFKLINRFHRDGDSGAACHVARSLVTLDPLDERSRFALIRLLASTQSLSVAKQEYADLEVRMKRDLGVSPSLPLHRLLSKVARNQPIDVISPVQARPSSSRWRIVAVVCLSLAIISVGVLKFAGQAPRSSTEILAEFSSTGGPPNASLALLTEQLAESSWIEAYGTKEEAWRALLAPKADRLLEVMTWAVQNDPEQAVQIGGALERYFLLINRQSEWAALLDEALRKAAPGQSAAYARALIAVAIANPAIDQSLNIERLHRAQQITKVLDDPFLQIQAVRAEGFLNAHYQRPVPARALYERALDMARQSKEERQIALCLFCLGIMGPDPNADPDDDLARRVRCAIESYDHFLTLSNVWGIRASSTVLASNCLDLAKRGTAKSVVEDGLKRLISAADQERALGNPPGRLQSLMAATRLAVRIGNKSTACLLLRQLIKDGAGASLGFAKLSQLRIACYALDQEYYLHEIAESPPSDEPARQSPQEIVESVLN